jgi:hypothetical protein
MQFQGSWNGVTNEAVLYSRKKEKILQHCRTLTRDGENGTTVRDSGRAWLSEMRLLNPIPLMEHRRWNFFSSLAKLSSHENLLTRYYFQYLRTYVPI